MAGIRLPGSMVTPRQGYQYSQERGYVPNNRIADETRPQWEVGPSGDIHRFMDDGRGWIGAGQMPASMDALNRVGSGNRGGSGERTADPQVKAMLLDAIRRAGQPSAPPQGPVQYSPRYEQEAETSALTGAKERAGLRLQAGAKGLSSLMSRRGISGSGIHGRGLSDLYGQSMLSQGDTDRQIIQNRTQRGRQVDDSNFQSQLHYNDMQSQHSLADADRLSRILQAYGMVLY